MYYQEDELKYSLKRLVDGLSHAREDARTGYSLALAQVSNVMWRCCLTIIMNMQTASYDMVNNFYCRSSFILEKLSLEMVF